MPFLNAVVMVVIVLAIAVVMLSLFAMATRALSNRRESRIDRQREDFMAAIRRYVAGDTGLQATARAAPHRKDVALGAVLSVAADAPPGQFAALHDLADYLGLAQREIAALGHHDWARRAHAATRLGILRYAGASDALVGALDDRLLDVRLAAARSLAQLKAADAIPAIVASLALPAAWPLQRCAEILVEMGAPGVEPMLALLHREALDAPGTAAVVKALGVLRARHAGPALVKLLKNPDREIRLSSAKALGQIGVPAATPALREALGDPEWPVRSAAAVALGALGDASAVPAIAGRLADGAWWVRFNAAQALYRLDGAGELRAAGRSHADPFARDISRKVLEESGAAIGVPS